MISTVIFDLDGLLADTERLHCRAYQLAFAEHGVELGTGEYAEHWIRHGKGIVEWVDRQGLTFDPHELRKRKSQHYLNLLESSLRPMDGALELLEFLHDKFRIALASSSYRDAIDGVVVERFAVAACIGAHGGRISAHGCGFLRFGAGLRASAARDVGLLAAGAPGPARDGAVIETDHVA